MKKKLIVCLIPFLIGLGACQNVPTTSSSETTTSEVPSTSSVTTSSMSFDPEYAQEQDYYFYIDYNHSEEPFFIYHWYMYYPIGECPEGAKLTDEDATDPLFPHFLGWSMYPSSLDDSKLWNFKTDGRPGKICSLYGIWVAED